FIAGAYAQGPQPQLHGKRARTAESREADMEGRRQCRDQLLAIAAVIASPTAVCHRAQHCVADFGILRRPGGQNGASARSAVKGQGWVISVVYRHRDLQVDTRATVRTNASRL